MVVGGANGIGLAIANLLAHDHKIESIIIVDRDEISEEYSNLKFKSVVFDLANSDYSIFEDYPDIDILIITAGFGRLSLFQNIDEEHIVSSFNVNTIAPIRIIKHYYHKLLSKDEFLCGVMVSIAGFMSSPFFSVYGASKAALKIFIESVNVELTKAGTDNRILNVSPGSIKGTAFNNGANDLSLTKPLAEEIISRLADHDDLFIPQYEEIFKDVLERYHRDFRAEGIHSYDYKLNSGRVR